MDRIEKLERQVRLQRYALIGICLLGLVAAKQSHIDCETLKAGQITATQGISADDPKSGDPRVSLVTFPSVSTATVKSPDGKSQIVLTAGDGDATISITSGKRRLRIDADMLDALNGMAGRTEEGYRIESQAPGR